MKKGIMLLKSIIANGLFPGFFIVAFPWRLPVSEKYKCQPGILSFFFTDLLNNSILEIESG